MENPETWDETDKAIVIIFEQYETEVKEGRVGLSLYRRLGDYVRAERLKALDDLIKLDKASR